MDTGLTVRPIVGLPQTGHGTQDPSPARDAVATVLAPSQSVTQAADTAATRNEAARAPSEPSVSHDVIIDPATREVIYRTVDVRSGQVISQMPDQMQLQIAAYTRAVQRAMEHGRTMTEAEAKADLEV
jgi:hypothetical protein